MYGINDYNMLTALFNNACLVFSVPMALLMKYVRLGILLPSCEELWTFVAMIMAVAKNKDVIYGLRFLQDVIEASTFAGLTFMIGEYYDSESLGKRMFMLESTGSVSRMFAGYLEHPILCKNTRFHLLVWGPICSNVVDVLVCRSVPR